MLSCCLELSLGEGGTHVIVLLLGFVARHWLAVSAAAGPRVQGSGLIAVLTSGAPTDRAFGNLGRVTSSM